MRRWVGWRDGQGLGGCAGQGGGSADPGTAWVASTRHLDEIDDVGVAAVSEKPRIDRGNSGLMERASG